MLTYTAGCGEHINHAAEQMVKMTKMHGRPIQSEFNGVTFFAHPGETVEQVVAKFNNETERRHKAYLASPEGQAATRRREEADIRAKEAEAEGVLPFTLKQGSEEEWRKSVEANSDPYGACAIRYAARWANLMEAAISTGARLEAIAEATSHAADKEGITGFMYGCAVSVLSQVWVHGEQLRRWHNLKTQIGKEGEKANATGGVLSPAMLRVR